MSNSSRLFFVAPRLQAGILGTPIFYFRISLFVCPAEHQQGAPFWSADILPALGISRFSNSYFPSWRSITNEFRHRFNSQTLRLGGPGRQRASIALPALCPRLLGCATRAKRLG